MESDGARADGGGGPPDGKRRACGYQSDHLYKRQEAAALLALWSALLLTEGTVRFIQAGPSRELFPADRPADVVPPALPFLAALVECVFGLTGLLVGVAAAFFDSHSRPVTVAFLVTQTILSWFAFVIFVLLVPAYRVRYLADPLFPFDTVGQSRAFLLAAILTSVALYLALQSGQFAFGMRLLGYQAPPARASSGQASKAAARGVFWNVTMVCGGLATTVAGLLLLVNAAGRGGAGRLDAAFSAPPHVGVFPVLTTATGLLMVVTGLVGVATCAARKLLHPFLALSVANFLLMYLNFTIAQVGAIRPTGPPEVGAYQSGVVVVAALIGPYYTYRAQLARHEVRTSGMNTVAV